MIRTIIIAILTTYSSLNAQKTIEQTNVEIANYTLINMTDEEVDIGFLSDIISKSNELYINYFNVKPQKINCYLHRNLNDIPQSVKGQFIDKELLVRITLNPKYIKYVNLTNESPTTSVDSNSVAKSLVETGFVNIPIGDSTKIKLQDKSSSRINTKQSLTGKKKNRLDHVDRYKDRQHSNSEKSNIYYELLSSFLLSNIYFANRSHDEITHEKKIYSWIDHVVLIDCLGELAKADSLSKRDLQLLKFNKIYDKNFRFNFKDELVRLFAFYISSYNSELEFFKYIHLHYSHNYFQRSIINKRFYWISKFLKAKFGNDVIYKLANWQNLKKNQMMPLSVFLSDTYNIKTNDFKLLEEFKFWYNAE